MLHSSTAQPPPVLHGSPASPAHTQQDLDLLLDSCLAFVLCALPAFPLPHLRTFRFVIYTAGAVLYCCCCGLIRYTG